MTLPGVLGGSCPASTTDTDAALWPLEHEGANPGHLGSAPGHSPVITMAPLGEAQAERKTPRGRAGLLPHGRWN